MVLTRWRAEETKPSLGLITRRIQQLLLTAFPLSLLLRVWFASDVTSFAFIFIQHLWRGAPYSHVFVRCAVQSDSIVWTDDRHSSSIKKKKINSELYSEMDIFYFDGCEDVFIQWDCKPKMVHRGRRKTQQRRRDIYGFCID